MTTDYFGEVARVELSGQRVRVYCVCQVCRKEFLPRPGTLWAKQCTDHRTTK